MSFVLPDMLGLKFSVVRVDFLDLCTYLLYHRGGRQISLGGVIVRIDGSMLLEDPQENRNLSSSWSATISMSHNISSCKRAPLPCVH